MKLAKQIEAIINLLATPESWIGGSCARSATGAQTLVHEDSACKFCLVGAAARACASPKDMADWNFSPYDWFNTSEVGTLIAACLPADPKARRYEQPYAMAYAFNDKERRNESYDSEFREHGTGHVALMEVLETARLHAKAAGI